MDYVTIMEAARRCGVSDKTIQRAIRRGTLPAQYPHPNRCEIAVSDLVCIRPGHVSGQMAEPLESRVAELERQVQDLERQMHRLRSRQEAPKARRVSRTRERTTGPLPRHLVSLLPYAQLHNVAEAKVLTHIDTGLLPVKRGEWMDTSGTPVTLALDAKGRQAFYQIYQGVPPFVPCAQCPHQDASTCPDRCPGRERTGSDRWKGSFLLALPKPSPGFRTFRT